MVLQLTPVADGCGAGPRAGGVVIGLLGQVLRVKGVQNKAPGGDGIKRDLTSALPGPYGLLAMLSKEPSCGAVPQER